MIISFDNPQITLLYFSNLVNQWLASQGKTYRILIHKMTRKEDNSVDVEFSFLEEKKEENR